VVLHGELARSGKAYEALSKDAAGVAMGIKRSYSLNERVGKEWRSGNLPRAKKEGEPGKGQR